VSEADWIKSWTMLADRYKSQPNVIGADLKNEPHGKASWGTGDRATDWRLAAERAGNAIGAVNPNWLIVVAGVERNVPGQKLRHWMGGNLEGVRKFPVRLKQRNKLIYSPHEYGAGVYAQPWFKDPTFPRNLTSRWETGFYYIARQGIAPILIGEFGGRQVDETSTEGRWQRKLVGFIDRERLSFAYWSLNPDSQDTGGILLDDWQTVDPNKQQLLSSLLPAATIPSTNGGPLPKLSPPLRPTPGPTLKPTGPSSPTPQPSAPSPSTQPSTRPSTRPSTQPATRPSPPAASGQPTGAPSANPAATLQVKSFLKSDWDKGVCTAIQVSNPSPRPVSGWGLKFELRQAQIDQQWNGRFQPGARSGQYNVIPADWAKTVQPNQTIELGFCATKQGPDYQPHNLRIESI
jgi:endoglucanase